MARHRVEGLVHDGLKRAGVVPPEALGASLAAEAGDIARRNLGFAAECKALAAMLDEAGADHLFIKGATLNILAYGTLALKKACDIDLLVDPDAYERAVELVEARGYRCVIPGPDPSRADILDWAKSHKHTIWNALRDHARASLQPGRQPAPAAGPLRPLAAPGGRDRVRDRPSDARDR